MGRIGQGFRANLQFVEEGKRGAGSRAGPHPRERESESGESNPHPAAAGLRALHLRDPPLAKTIEVRKTIARRLHVVCENLGMQSGGEHKQQLACHRRRHIRDARTRASRDRRDRCQSDVRQNYLRRKCLQEIHSIMANSEIREFDRALIRLQVTEASGTAERERALSTDERRATGATQSASE
jgi:hypothetical protein